MSKKFASIRIEVKFDNDDQFHEILNSEFAKKPFTMPVAATVRFSFPNGKVIEVESEGLNE
jgi:hypothetical protein